MLTEEQAERQAEETTAELEGLEVDLMALGVGYLCKGIADGYGDPTSFSNAARAKAARAKSRAEETALREMRDTLAQSMAGDYGEGVAFDAALARADMAAGPARARSAARVSQWADNMARYAVTDYSAILSQAIQDKRVMGYERAARKAVDAMLAHGIPAYEYQRANGTRVRVPVDVAVHRELSSSNNAARFGATMELAERLDAERAAIPGAPPVLVEVNTTANCRESHADWQGRIYQLKGAGQYPNFYSSCRYGDAVSGIGGYNCAHEFRIYDPDEGRKYRDPLDGTGYTREQAREIIAAQRRAETEIRNESRTIIVMDRAQHVDKATADAVREESRIRIQRARERLAGLQRQHPEIVSRKPWRETPYQSRPPKAASRGATAAKAKSGKRPSVTDGMHANGIPFVSYKGHRASYGTATLPNGGKFVGPTREEAVELLKRRYGE